MSEFPRYDPDRIEGAEQVLARRLQLGADQDLLSLFGGDLDEGSKVAVESGRYEIFARGFLAEADVDGDTSELLGVTDHGEVLYPGFQFEPGTAVPLPAAAYANGLLLAAGFHPWEAAFWWISNTLLLPDERTPLEMLDMNSEEAEILLRRAAENQAFDD